MLKKKMWILKQFPLCKQSSQFGRTLNVEKGKKRKRVLVCTELETPKQKTANVLVERIITPTLEASEYFCLWFCPFFQSKVKTLVFFKKTLVR